jgi:hypothetical protein
MIAWGVQTETTTLEIGPGERRIPSDDLLQPLDPACSFSLLHQLYCDLEFDSFMNGQLPFPQYPSMLTKTLPPLEGTISLEEAEKEGEGVAPLVIYQRGALSSLVKLHLYNSPFPKVVIGHLCEFASTGDLP